MTTKRYALCSTIHTLHGDPFPNPINCPQSFDVTIKLKNGQSVQLSMARDYIYNSAATFKKLDQLMEIAKENSIPVHNRMRNISDKSDKMTVETW
jgi:hypothetical protein